MGLEHDPATNRPLEKRIDVVHEAVGRAGQIPATNKGSDSARTPAPEPGHCEDENRSGVEDPSGNDMTWDNLHHRYSGDRLLLAAVAATAIAAWLVVLVQAL